MDCIRLKNLILFARLGVTPWEKMGIQRVSCDVDLYLDLSAAAMADRIAAAVDYQEACRVILDVARARKYHLIESLAQEILRVTLEHFQDVQRVGVRLRKTNLPFDAHLDAVEVQMERSR